MSCCASEQIIRPTGLLDPPIDVRPVAGQMDDLIAEVNKETERKNKVLITTLTKRMAEDLTDYMREAGIRVQYLHSDIDTLERTEIIRDMRLDVFDVLVGINLLREGLDIPEITPGGDPGCGQGGLPAFGNLPDSDDWPCGTKCRRSCYHVCGQYDGVHARRRSSETNRRREIQQEYNDEHGITPTSIQQGRP